MSLLLDALKRAAEQKAAKAREDESGSADAPDTALDVSSETARPGNDADDGSIPRHRLEDETELDPSELDTRLERLRDRIGDGTETGLRAPDEGDSTLLPPTGRSRSAEDETFIFAEDDAAEVMNDDHPDRLRSAEDETDLSQLIAEGTQAAADEHAPEEAGDLSGEDTDLRQPESSGDPGGAKPRAARGEETDLSLPTGHPEPLPADEFPARDEDTDLGAGIQGEGDNSAGDEDMSLLLVEHEPTRFRDPTQSTDPQHPQDALQALQAEAPTAEDLGLVETTQNRFAEDSASAADTTRTRAPGGENTTTRNRTGDTATTGITTATASLHNVPRPDPGATHTHAPDNYDRTLMRLPNDEASRLFAGMKSDPDMVMTPEYAKRVFRSKSSALRFQHFKVYSGIAVAILLGIGVYGIFEYQAESESIDANLLPLKNDPFPGTISLPGSDPQPEPMFAEAEVNERALEILQNADNFDEQPATDETPATENDDGANIGADPATAEAPAEIAAAESLQPAADEAVAAPAGESRQPKTPVDEAVIPEPIAASEPVIESSSVAASGSTMKSSETGTRVADTGTSRPIAANVGDTGSGLRIQTGQRLEQKQVLLREAYEAYRAGNDELALQRYNQVLAMDPGNRNALLARAAIYVQNGDGGAAIEDYQALLLANPKDSLAMASLLAVANYSPVETETQLKLMIRDEPESPHLNFALANAYAAQKRWREAQGHYFTALQYNPDDPNYAYNLAVSLEHISQPRAAVSYYRRALENYNKGLATFSREAVDRRLEKLAKS